LFSQKMPEEVIRESLFQNFACFFLLAKVSSFKVLVIKFEVSDPVNRNIFFIWLLLKGGFPLIENFPLTGTEQTGKASGHARMCHMSRNFLFCSVPKKAGSSSTLSVCTEQKHEGQV